MKLKSGRACAALLIGLSMGAALPAPAEEPARLPDVFQETPSVVGVGGPGRKGSVTLSEGLTAEPVREIPMVGAKVQVPEPPPPTGLNPQPLPPANSAAQGGTVAPAPIGQIVGPVGEAQYPTVYRDRPRGGAKRKAEIIANNRGSEPGWYHEWRCTYYGYYPTQWRPFPDGWHAGRAVYPPPHPYDLKQPDPEGGRLDVPSRMRDRERDAGGGNSARAQPGRLPEGGNRPPAGGTGTNPGANPGGTGT